MIKVLDSAGKHVDNVPGNSDPVEYLAAINSSLDEGALGYHLDDDDLNAFMRASAIARAKAQVNAFIDGLADTIVSKYTATEQAGWTAWIVEAKKYKSSKKAADAPLLSIEAQIKGVKLADRVDEVIAASQITAVLPSLASGIRSRAGNLIDATEGDPVQLQQVLGLLMSKRNAIAQSIATGDAPGVIAAAATGWDID